MRTVAQQAHGYHERTVLNRLDLRGATDLAALLQPPATDDDVTAAVRAIIADVRARGDAALRELTERFDGCRVDRFLVPRAELDAALRRAEPAFRAALAYAAAEIRAYHELQLQPGPHRERTGIELEEITRPVDRAGLYVPGGRASYPSTVLMTAIPAQVAGVPEIVLCVPPGPDGLVPEATLAAAALVGIDEVFRVGGAQAIAALAYGTETIRPVDVVVGPGNAYVAAAKREVAGVVGIDALAGPSEVMVVADASAPPSSSPPISWRRPSTARVAPPSSCRGTPKSPTRSTPRSPRWSPTAGPLPTSKQHSSSGGAR